MANPTLPLLENYLDQTNPKVALLARVGSDVSKYNMHYTHMAFVMRNPQTQQWQIIHLLNPNQSKTSYIATQPLSELFNDKLFKLDVQITQLTPEFQNKLATVLSSDKINTFHNTRYSMIAYPFSMQYQNSNQWLLEILTAALNSNIQNRVTAQAYLKKTGYTPTLIPIGFFQRLGAYFTKPHVSFDDHPPEEFKTEKYSVVTVDSVVDYLRLQKVIANQKEIRERLSNV